MQIEVNIDISSNEFVLSGDVEQLLANRRVKFYLYNTLNAVKNTNNTISISFLNKNQEHLLENFTNALKNYGVKIIASNEIKSVLGAYYKEKENFEIFGKKAKAIWNNEIDLNDFKNFEKVISSKIPNRTLYDKQLLAAFHLAFSQNACNFSVPGSGKTTIVFAAYAFLNSLPVNNPKYVNKILVIGPLSSFRPWENEYKDCFGKIPDSIRLSGGIPKEVRDRHLLSIEPSNNTPELTLMSYQSVAYNLNSLISFLTKKDNKVMIVLDEAHKIKNIDGGIWAQSVLQLAQFCSSRVVLTGTPTPNGYEDIYNMYEFIWPDKDIIDFNTSQLQEMSNNPFDLRINKLIENITPFFVRIKKSDTLNPLIYPIIENPPIYIDMDPIQREIYDFIENKYIPYFENNENNLDFSNQLVKTRVIRLMQAATNPNLLNSALINFEYEEYSNNTLFIDDREILNKIVNYSKLKEVPKKFVKVRELVSNIINKEEKVVIWGSFIQTIKELQKYLEDCGIHSEVLIGEIPVERDDIDMKFIKTREKIIDEFHNKNSSFKVILANPYAVSESISLHKACHNAIYLERTFNAGNFIQSKDRIHRVGLEPNTKTFYTYLLSRNSIDEAIHTRLLEKEQRMLKLIENNDIPLFVGNSDYDSDFNDDIKAIIRGYVRRFI